MRGSKCGDLFAARAVQRPPSGPHLSYRPRSPFIPSPNFLIRNFLREFSPPSTFCGNFFGAPSVRMSVALFQSVSRFVALENLMRDEKTLFPSQHSSNNRDDG